MKLQVYKQPLEFIVIDDFYEDFELKRIWSELEFLKSKFIKADHTSAATDASGKSLKKSEGIFLDEVYKDKSFSDILNLNQKIFCDAIIEQILNFNPLYKLYLCPDNIYSLVNYYEDTDYYEPHVDISTFTAITILYKEPKKFDGGVLSFPDYDVNIESKNNRLILFPSMVKHGVSEMKMNDNEQGFGRYSIAQFIHSTVYTIPQ
jgi:predicted 2-oxoglutarate/Fe(II)-dependent dioxygenase YbiX